MKNTVLTLLMISVFSAPMYGHPSNSLEDETLEISDKTVLNDKNNIGRDFFLYKTVGPGFSQGTDKSPSYYCEINLGLPSLSFAQWDNPKLNQPTYVNLGQSPLLTYKLLRLALSDSHKAEISTPNPTERLPHVTYMLTQYYAGGSGRLDNYILYYSGEKTISRANSDFTSYKQIIDQYCPPVPESIIHP